MKSHQESAACQPPSAPSGAGLPKEKQTSLGLYATAKEAHEKWTLCPEKVRILDVRTPEEYLFIAVNLLAQAGFKEAYNITDGMEGDAVTDPQSPVHGQRLVNGWKNSGLPWTYKINPDLMRLPKLPSTEVSR